MTLQQSGPISLFDLQDELGGSNPISLSEYYRGGAYTTDNNTNVPTSGAISIDDFYGASFTVDVIYELQGGGGAGGQGWATSGTSAGGSPSSFKRSGSFLSAASAAGGAGGVDRSLFGSTPGEASYYGAGGQQGRTSDTSGNQSAGYDAPATSYGAGGGGGGGYPFNAYNSGGGGNAGERETGTKSYSPGTQLSVTVGSGGPRGSSAGAEGGAGAGGYVKLTVNGVSTEYTTPGTYTYTVPN